jgi:Domain of unknown function (DUF6458)
MNGELPPRRQPIGRYTAGVRAPGPRGAGGGSVTVVIQHEQPPETSNWRPAPAAPSAPQELSEGRLAVSIGISIFLLLAGAILRFAVTWSPKNVDLQIIGVILMIGGGAGLIASIVLYFMKRRRLQAQEAAFQPPRYTEPPPRYTEPPPTRYMEPPQPPL